MLDKPLKSSPVSHVAAGPDVIQVESPADLHDVRILVIDDEIDARRLISLVLRAAGALVYMAQSKDAALQTAAHTSFDVLISDLSMPGGDGFSLLEQLRQEGHQMPAIALSALPMADIQARVQQAGFAVHIEKPIDLSTLAMTVADLLGRHKAQEANTE
jgi:CheY-like chemotaxis protein